MALLHKEISSIVGGVSQQTPSKRTDSQVSEAVNMNLSPIRGATSRPPTRNVHLEPLSIPSDTSPTVIHYIDRDSGEKYLVSISQHDAAGAPLTDAVIRVFDAVDGTEYTVHVDTDAIDYLTPQAAPSKLSIVTLYDTTIIANADALPAMEPAPSLATEDECLITFNSLPINHQVEQADSIEIQSEEFLIARNSTTANLDLNLTGSNLSEVQRANSLLDDAIWIVQGPAPWGANGWKSVHNQIKDAFTKNVGASTNEHFTMQEALSFFRDGWLYPLQNRGFTHATATPWYTSSGATITQGAATTTGIANCAHFSLFSRQDDTPHRPAPGNGGPPSGTGAAQAITSLVEVDVNEWPSVERLKLIQPEGPLTDFDRAVATQNTGSFPDGSIHAVNRDDYEPVVFNMSQPYVFAVDYRNTIRGVSVFSNGHEILYPAAANVSTEPKHLTWWLIFHDANHSVMATQNTDKREVQIKYEHVIASTANGGTAAYDHFRSPTITWDEFQALSRSNPEYGRHGNGDRYTPEWTGFWDYGGPNSNPFNYVKHAGNLIHDQSHICEVTNLDNSGPVHTSSENQATFTNPYHTWNYVHIKPDQVDSNWNGVLIVDSPADTMYIGETGSPSYEYPANGMIQNVLNTKLSETATFGESFVLQSAGHKYLTTTQPGASPWSLYSTAFRWQDQDSTQFSAEASTYNYPAWEWVAHGATQIHGTYLSTYFDNWNPTGTPPSLPHPNYVADLELRDNHISFETYPTSVATVITRSGGPPTVADLPSTAPDGFLTRITGDVEADGDEYWLKYSSNGGAWVEGRIPNESHTLDPTTMPHILRRVTDAGGVVSFVFSAASEIIDPTIHATYPNPSTSQWDERLVGDDKNAKLPSFIGSSISSLFFYRNRLSIISGSDIVMSETSEPFNFFKTSIMTLVDTDPIDVRVSQSRGSVVSLFAALPLENGVMLFDREQQFLLRSDEGEVFSPRTAHISTISGYPVSENPKPIYVGSRVFWGSNTSTGSQVWEFAPTSGGSKYEDITQHVPTYIPSDLYDLRGNEGDSIITARSASAETSLFIYQYVYANNGDKLQQAWSRWDLGGKILYADWVRENLTLIVAREDGYRLETINMRKTPDLDGIEFNLDQKFKWVNLGQNNPTTQVLHFGIAGSRLIRHEFGTANLNTTWMDYITPDHILIAGVNTAIPGAIVPYTVSSLGLEISSVHAGGGDNEEFLLGVPYTSSISLSPFYLRSNDRRLVRQNNHESGRTQIKTVSVGYESSVYVTAETARDGVATTQVSIQNDLYPGIATFDVNGRNTTTAITLSNAYTDIQGTVVPSHVPVTINSINYEFQYYSRGKGASSR